MSIFRLSDYGKPKERVKNQRITCKKTRLPTEFRTRIHKCSQCTRTDANRFQIGGKDFRWLCIVCRGKHEMRDVKESPHYLKASKMYRKGVMK